MRRLLQALALFVLFAGLACTGKASGSGSAAWSATPVDYFICALPTPTAPTYFMPLAIHLDSPAAVAAWQFELTDRNGAMTVVGVENGGHPAFPRTPYYDREAVARGDAERIVLADYSLAEESLLPIGRVRLATLHLMLEGEPDFELRLIAATTPEGEAIDAAISYTEPDDNTREKAQ